MKPQITIKMVKNFVSIYRRVQNKYDIIIILVLLYYILYYININNNNNNI